MYNPEVVHKMWFETHKPGIQKIESEAALQTTVCATSRSNRNECTSL